MSDPDPATALIAEQFRRTIDLLRSENAALQRHLLLETLLDIQPRSSNLPRKPILR
jgi:hypothetical protein